jgi:hypothetical protein
VALDVVCDVALVISRDAASDLVGSQYMSNVRGLIILLISGVTTSIFRVVRMSENVEITLGRFNYTVTDGNCKIPPRRCLWI